MTEGVALTVDPRKFSANDLVDFEEATGKDLFDVLPDDEETAAKFRPSAKVMRALIWIVKRQENPDLSLLEAGKTTLGELTLILGGADRPTDGAGSDS